MLVKDVKGNELLDLIKTDEDKADAEYQPITHCLAVVKVGGDYLLGWNKYRQEWEIFGGCREDGETIRKCIERECEEELGIKDGDYTSSESDIRDRYICCVRAARKHRLIRHACLCKRQLQSSRCDSSECERHVL